MRNLVKVNEPEAMDVLQALRFFMILWIVLDDRFSQLYFKPAMGLFQFNDVSRLNLRFINL